MRIVILIVFLSGLAASLPAQIRRTQPGGRAESAGGSPIWWGGNFQLGFSGFNGITSIQFGLAPMVGYKITPAFSVGPRVGAVLSYFSFRAGGERFTKAPISWSVGAFSRYKITDQIFAHGEYEYQDQALVFDNGFDLDVLRVARDNIYIGGGYSSGIGANRGEILLLYNLNRSTTAGSFQPPLTIRFGFTHNF